MCTGMEMLALGTTLIGGIGALAASPPKPPKPTVPAQPAPTTNLPDAKVTLGDTGDENVRNTSKINYDPLEEKRSSGNSLGNLGRSGLAL